MALNFTLQLDNSEGLMKVVSFSGLSHPIVVHPILHSEPVLTAQAFYYLQQLESAASIRFETKADEISEEDVELIVDNYLFEYSKIYPESRISFKISEGKFWEDDYDSFYIMVDQRHTESLVIDILNDEDVLSVEAIDSVDEVDLSNWDIGRSYADECFQPYLKNLSAILDKKINVTIFPSERRDGYIGKLRVLKPGYGLIDRMQAISLADISTRDCPPSVTEINLPGLGNPHTLNSLPIERVTATILRSPILLSHYFSGLKELNPLKSFVGFYNVLEYYFEEAPKILGQTAKNELEQISSVVEWLVTDGEIVKFFEYSEPEVKHIIDSDLPTSSAIPIKAFNKILGYQKELPRWLYEIRCAVIHSKKTRRGIDTPTFEPYTKPSQGLKHVVPIIRWLAILCIDKDSKLTISS